GGNGRARAVARDDETAGVGARGGSVPVGPRNGGEAVVDGRGERVFGCETVFYRHHQAVGAQGQAPAHSVVAVEAAANEAASVKIDNHRRAVHLEGAVDPQGEGASRPVDGSVLDGKARGRLG